MMTLYLIFLYLRSSPRSICEHNYFALFDPSFERKIIVLHWDLYPGWVAQMEGYSQKVAHNISWADPKKEFFQKRAIPGLFFSLFASFQHRFNIVDCKYNFADDWIRTADLWYQPTEPEPLPPKQKNVLLCRYRIRGVKTAWMKFK